MKFVDLLVITKTDHLNCPFLLFSTHKLSQSAYCSNSINLPDFMELDSNFYNNQASTYS